MCFVNQDHRGVARPERVALSRQYDTLWRRAFVDFRRGRCSADAQLAGRLPDDRRGVTLLARVPESLRLGLAPARFEMEAVFHDQYLVPETDLHITCLSVEPVRSGYRAEASRIAAIVAAVEEALAGDELFEIEVTGLGASASAVFARGYPCDDALNAFRNRLRQGCRRRGVGLDADRRYVLRGAHMTLLRFVTARITETQIRWLRDRRLYPGGCHQLAEVVLVEHDWYNRVTTAVIHRRWRLPGA
jgi:2'-5' RNA ligase